MAISLKCESHLRQMAGDEIVFIERSEMYSGMPHSEQFKQTDDDANRQNKVNQIHNSAGNHRDVFVEERKNNSDNDEHYQKRKKCHSILSIEEQFKASKF
jgi:3'-phosphoadenosine 5'-phosphosulfate (PAPS) 3'-phosphatase